MVTRYTTPLTNKYAQIYQPKAAIGWLTASIEEFVVSFLPRPKDIAILDLACGVGSYCWRVARMGYREIVGIDVSASQIRACFHGRDSVPKNLSFIQSNVKSLIARPEFRERFD